jgi:hypothetical protein
VAPAIVFDVKFNVDPSHIAELLPAIGVAGVGFTTTKVVPIALAQALTVVVNV